MSGQGGIYFRLSRSLHPTEPFHALLITEGALNSQSDLSLSETIDFSTQFCPSEVQLASSNITSKEEHEVFPKGIATS